MRVVCFCVFMVCDCRLVRVGVLFCILRVLLFLCLFSIGGLCFVLYIYIYMFVVLCFYTLLLCIVSFLSVCVRVRVWFI